MYADDHCEDLLAILIESNINYNTKGYSYKSLIWYKNKISLYKKSIITKKISLPN